MPLTQQTEESIEYVIDQHEISKSEANSGTPKKNIKQESYFNKITSAQAKEISMTNSQCNQTELTEMVEQSKIIYQESNKITPFKIGEQAKQTDKIKKIENKEKLKQDSFIVDE